ncbi:MAG: hypothetical protein IT343_22950 [Candidatus Melainabacteria bacterium]|jgi:preprotein translocase subunit SecD|nr:hypothetical protein [Candidatus Melainabacteria bacterium]
MKRLLIGMVFIFTMTNCSLAEAKALTDGLYLIQREADAQKDLEPLRNAEHVLINDYEFLSPAERGKITYVVVNKESFIPIILKERPVKETDEKGKPKLSISLADDQVAPLERFTRENVMKNVAIVIGGKVVTTHKIRVPIVGGKMQITRCTDQGCEALYTELIKRDSK